ncbi:MAG TPA: MoxR family ATPase [Candidatus Cloacimonadota bacterium]|nr:MoxR family ATPase [Candidatus Cloacimonadota bacterium]HQL14149.1 MoxR family ATPase [Candidatus Cloacimonadota bacterium]
MSDQLELIEALQDKRKQLLTEIHKVIIGQDRVIDDLIIGLFSNGHMLIEGVPGLAKTLLISTLAEVLNLSFSRIQFTPDLMPSDITGSEILNQASNRTDNYYEFIKGPVFANLVLADEINRTPPKTQAALLQAMQENQVTYGNRTWKLDLPFHVMATQNPIEQEGTYPLPEAQLDRFMFYINIGYPTLEEEKQIVAQTAGVNDNKINRVMNAEELIAAQKAVRSIPAGEHVINFAVNLVRATRPNEPGASDYIKKWVNWGAGPRASQFLIIAAKARAALLGRLTPAEEDVIQVAEIVLQHRIIVSFAAETEGISSKDIIKHLIQKG